DAKHRRSASLAGAGLRCLRAGVSGAWGILDGDQCRDAGGLRGRDGAGEKLCAAGQRAVPAPFSRHGGGGRRPVLAAGDAAGGAGAAHGEGDSRNARGAELRVWIWVGVVRGGAFVLRGAGGTRGGGGCRVAVRAGAIYSGSGGAGVWAGVGASLPESFGGAGD